MTPDSVELLPCPFCGGEAHAGGYQACDCCGADYNGYVNCACGASVSHCPTTAEAIAAWNRRAVPQQAGGEDVLRFAMTPAGTRKASKTGPYVLYTDYAALQAKVVRLQRERAELIDKLNGTPCAEVRWQQERERLQAALLEAGRDAERYRWLRRDVELVRYASGMDHLPLNRPVIVVAEDQNGRIREFALSDDDADAAIDAALNGGQDDA